MNVWFTADQHFGHARANMLMHRPFFSVEEMDEVLIDRWNKRVANTDTVYHLGDFAFADNTPYLKRLNGQKHLASVGNHDHSNRVKKAVGWASVDRMRDVKDLDALPIVLCHYALRVWNRSHYGALHFYGHSHGSLPGDSQSCDVGVDCWNYAPVSLEEIRVRLATLPRRGEPDHHRPKEPE